MVDFKKSSNFEAAICEAICKELGISKQDGLAIYGTRWPIAWFERSGFECYTDWMENALMPSGITPTAGEAVAILRRMVAEGSVHPVKRPVPSEPEPALEPVLVPVAASRTAA